MSINTSPSTVFSIRPFTMRAAFTSVSHLSFASIIGVLIFFAAFIISLMRGTPRVISSNLLGHKIKYVCVRSYPIRKTCKNRSSSITTEQYAL